MLRASVAALCKGRAYATKTTCNLTRPSFPLKDIVSNPGIYQQSVDLRKVTLFENQTIADLVQQYHNVGSLKKQRQAAATERNQVVEEVKRILSAANKRDVLPEVLRTRSSELKKLITRVEKELVVAEQRLHLLVETVPNLIEPSVAEIDGDFSVISQTSDDLIPPDKNRDHVVLGTEIGILDMAAASKVSGTGNAYLVGKGALLEQALIQYALTRCSQNGFKLVSPPSLVRSEFIDACGFQPRDESTHVYRVENEDFCLAGTAEIPLASQFAEQTIESLPQKHCGVMRSFRAEAASKGADSRGLYRLHEFSKVEMFVWTNALESHAMLDELVKIQQSIFNELLVADLGIPLRTIKLAPTDLGAPAYKKYDIEAWMPGRGTWGEISSASNCLDYQARRLHTVDSDGGYVHTLNATGLAIPRIIVAILENGWDPSSRTVRLPKVLHPFMDTDRI